MELCHQQFWSKHFPSFAPHYSDSPTLSDAKVIELDKLNLAKTMICVYLIVFSLLLRISHFILLPVVMLVGAPGFMIYNCIWIKQELKKEAELEAAQKYANNEESAKK